MDCTRARSAILERSVGELGYDGEARLAAHLRTCAGCRSESREHERVVADLQLLGDEPPFEVSVVGRVLERIERLPRPEPRDVPARQLGWASAACLAAGAALAALFAASLPELRAGVERGAEMASALAPLARALLRPLVTLLRVPLDLLEGLLASGGPLATLWSSLEPAAWTAVGVAYLAMTATMLAVVGRDLLRGAPVRRHGGHPR